MIPTLTKEDWVEIYYALEYKLTSPALQGDDREARRWRKHIKDIIETIGPDGNHMNDMHARFSARGGKARAKALSKEERAQVAREAAKARWANHKYSDKPSAKSHRKRRQEGQ